MDDKTLAGLMPDESLSESKLRMIRARSLLSNLDPNLVIESEENRRVEPGSYNFCTSLAKVVNGESNREITDIELKRLEDIYLWSYPNMKLTPKQKKQILDWCKRDGHNELVENIEQVLEKGDEDD